MIFFYSHLQNEAQISELCLFYDINYFVSWSVRGVMACPRWDTLRLDYIARIARYIARVVITMCTTVSNFLRSVLIWPGDRWWLNHYLYFMSMTDDDLHLSFGKGTHAGTGIVLKLWSVHISMRNEYLPTSNLKE